MAYQRGIEWNLTHLDGKAVTWVSDAGMVLGIASVLDPESDQPARRIDPKTGDATPLDGCDRGLTVYGHHAWGRPTLTRFRTLAPEYAHLAQGIEERRGITQFDFTNAGDDRALDVAGVAFRKGITKQTVYRYKTKGTLPEPDFYEGRSPRWYESTIDSWVRPGQGVGGGRPAKS